MIKKQMLFVGNDRAVYQSFQNWISSENIEVSCVPSAADALEFVLKYEYCLVIMSYQLTEAGNIELLRMIRNAKNMPIIVLANRLTSTDKVSLLHAGANACFEHPIDFSICFAQATSLIHLFLKAKGETEAHSSLDFGSELLIDTMYRQVIIDGKPPPLTCKEYELLVCLAKHPCQIWSRAQLYRYVWNDDLGISGDNTVKTHIGNLKKKFAELGKGYIQNSRGVGYKFVPLVATYRASMKRVP